MDWAVIASALGSAVSLTVLVGLVVRFALVPYLRDHLVIPVHETRKQVTENHHSNDPPTVLDRIDDVHRRVDTAIDKVDTLGRMFDGHLEWSQNEVDRIWEALKRQRERGER